MYRVISIVLISVLSILGRAELLCAQAIVEGRLTDTDSQQLLQGAHVFLSGTKIGDQTDHAGRYRMNNVPPGSHRLVVSMVGYGKKVYVLQIGPKDHKIVDLNLKPVVYEMNDLDVGRQSRRWEKNYERFQELFLGYTEAAESVVILNPEVLRFNANFWGHLSAEALAPLRIENRTLGYHIIYYLDEFKHTGLKTRWDGESVFTEMNPSDSLQQARWEENRRKAFYGSMRHFWLSLLQDRLEEEGFLLYNVKESGLLGLPDTRQPVAFKRLMRPGKKYYLHKVQYTGSLEVIYTREDEDYSYLKWSGERDRSPGNAQFSWLELNEKFVTVDTDGEIVEPYGAIQSGYFGFHRLADLTPREYRPEDF